MGMDGIDLFGIVRFRESKNTLDCNRIDLEFTHVLGYSNSKNANVFSFMHSVAHQISFQGDLATPLAC